MIVQQFPAEFGKIPSHTTDAARAGNTNGALTGHLSTARSTALAHSAIPSEDASQTPEPEWLPETFDPEDERVIALAANWRKKSHQYYAKISALILQDLVNVWSDSGPTFYAADIQGEYWADEGIPPEITSAALVYLANRGLIVFTSDGGVKLPYSHRADYEESFDYAFPGIRNKEAYSIELPQPRVVADQRLAVPEQSGTVYLIRCHDRFKIGVTKDLAQRFSQLQNNQSPYPLEIVHHVSGVGYTTFEKELHRRHADKRVHGEWFLLSDPDDVQDVVRAMNEWAEGGE